MRQPERGSGREREREREGGGSAGESAEGADVGVERVTGEILRAKITDTHKFGSFRNAFLFLCIGH